MRESLLAAFLEGETDGAELADGLADLLGRQAPVPGKNLITDLDRKVPVTAAHLVRLCDAHVQGEIDSDDLKAAARFLLAAEHFGWDPSAMDGELVDQVLREWAAPESHYPLTGSNVERYRAGLLEGKHAFRR